MPRPQRSTGTEQRTSLTPLLDALDKVYRTKGPTYSLREQNAILAGTPEFLFRGVRLAETTALGQRCARALDEPAGVDLSALEREVERLTRERVRAELERGAKRG